MIPSGKTLGLAALVLLAAAPAPVQAQSYGGVDDAQVTAPGFFVFARPGEAVVSVTAVGAVGGSGR